MKTWIVSVVISLGAWCMTSFAQESGSAIVWAEVPAPSMIGSVFQTPPIQPAVIYLPPSYTTSSRRYPVVYYLPGYSDMIYYYTDYGVYQGFNLKVSMDQLIRENKVKEMIVVIANGANFMFGSFYVNSPLTGNWEDFVSHDLVSYVDSAYRTIPDAASRGLSGHSMGGFGALNSGMRHPDVFGHVYSLAPGLFAPDGLQKNIMFSTSKMIDAYLTWQKEFETGEGQPEVKFMAFMNLLGNKGSFMFAFSYAYGAAFAPNVNGRVPFIDYPYARSGGTLVKNKAVWERYEDGFGGWAEKVRRYRENLVTLRTIVIDFGTADEHEWISEGCRYVSGLFAEAGIRHTLMSFEGGHTDRVRGRLETVMFPLFSRQLAFE